jgi:hypothetical protein
MTDGTCARELPPDLLVSSTLPVGTRVLVHEGVVATPVTNRGAIPKSYGRSPVQWRILCRRKAQMEVRAWPSASCALAVSRYCFAVIFHPRAQSP